MKYEMDFEMNPFLERKYVKMIAQQDLERIVKVWKTFLTFTFGTFFVFREEASFARTVIWSRDVDTVLFTFSMSLKAWYTLVLVWNKEMTSNKFNKHRIY